jgi:hypothetical protein
MSTEIITPDKQELTKFVLDHADDLKDKAIEIRIKNGNFVAELYSTQEPSV